jgi:hypothetical protein
MDRRKVAQTISSIELNFVRTLDQEVAEIRIAAVAHGLAALSGLNFAPNCKSSPGMWAEFTTSDFAFFITNGAAILGGIVHKSSDLLLRIPQQIACKSYLRLHNRSTELLITQGEQKPCAQKDSAFGAA